MLLSKFGDTATRDNLGLPELGLNGLTFGDTDNYVNFYLSSRSTNSQDN